MALKLYGVSPFLHGRVPSLRALPFNLTFSGHIQRLDLSWEDMPLSIVYLYAPSSSDQCVDFHARHLLPALLVDGQILMERDFSCVASDLDFIPNAFGSRAFGYAGGLQLVEETHGLHDAWRELHTALRAFTRTCASNLTGGRLDRRLLTCALLPYLGGAKEVAGLPGDHQAMAI